MSLLCSCLCPIILILIHCRQSLVEELTEHVTFGALLLLHQLRVDVFKVKVDDDIVEIVVGAETHVIVRCDRNAPSTERKCENFLKIAVLKTKRSVKK